MIAGCEAARSIDDTLQNCQGLGLRHRFGCHGVLLLYNFLPLLLLQLRLEKMAGVVRELIDDGEADRRRVSFGRQRTAQRSACAAAAPAFAREQHRHGKAHGFHGNHIGEAPAVCEFTVEAACAKAVSRDLEQPRIRSSP